MLLLIKNYCKYGIHSVIARHKNITIFELAIQHLYQIIKNKNEELYES